MESINPINWNAIVIQMIHSPHMDFYILETSKSDLQKQDGSLYMLLSATTKQAMTFWLQCPIYEYNYGEYIFDWSWPKMNK